MADQIAESQAVPEEQSREKSMTTGFFKLFNSQTLGLLIRASQVVFSILVICLTAITIDSYANSGPPYDSLSFSAILLSLIVSIISLVYLVFLLGFSYFKPKYLNVGAIIILEGSILLLLLISFIYLAVMASEWSCEYGDFYDDMYFIDSNSTPCKTGKAAIAFIGANWVLYCFSSVIFIVNVLVPVAKLDGKAVFKFLKVNGVKLDYPVLNSDAAREKSMTTGISISQTVGLLIRVSQVVFSILVIGLTAYTTTTLTDDTNIGFVLPPTLYSLIVSIISLVYLVFLLGFSYFKPQYLNVGAIFILEEFILLLFFSSFIYLTAIGSDWTCEGYGYYFLDESMYFVSFNTIQCKTEKAAIGFSAANCVLYCFSFVFFIVNVLAPLAKLDGKAVFKFLKVNGINLDYPALNVTNWGSLDTTAKLDEEQVVGIEEVNRAAAAAATATREKSMTTGISKSFISQTVGLIIRVFQVIFSIVVIGLTANTTATVADGATIYSLIVSIISLVYLVFLLGFSFFKPQYLNVGAIIILEGFLHLLLLGSFLALAVIAGQWSCEGTYYYFFGEFLHWADFNTIQCKTEKAAIAFIGANWVLYCFSFVIFIVNVLAPLAKLDGKAVFKFLKVNGVKLDYSVLNVTNWGSLYTTAKLVEEQVVGIEEVNSAAAAATATTTSTATVARTAAPTVAAAATAAATATAASTVAPTAAPTAAPTVVPEEPVEPVEPEEPVS